MGYFTHVFILHLASLAIQTFESFFFSFNSLRKQPLQSTTSTFKKKWRKKWTRNGFQHSARMWMTYKRLKFQKRKFCEYKMQRHKHKTLNSNISDKMLTRLWFKLIIFSNIKLRTLTRWFNGTDDGELSLVYRLFVALSILFFYLFHKLKIQSV